MNGWLRAAAFMAMISAVAYNNTLIKKKLGSMKVSKDVLPKIERAHFLIGYTSVLMQDENRKQYWVGAVTPFLELDSKEKIDQFVDYGFLNLAAIMTALAPRGATAAPRQGERH